MPYFNQEDKPNSFFDQVIDYCWRAATEDTSSEGIEAETTQKYRKFWELISLYVSGDWDVLTGVMTVKKEDVNALL